MRRALARRLWPDGLAGRTVLVLLGSLLAAWAPSLPWLVAGRALQGAGAISAAVTALLADLTRDSVRTKAMALVGISIALMFALSLVLACLAAAGAYSGYRLWERRKRKRDGMEQELVPGPYKDLKSMASSNSSFKA